MTTDTRQRILTYIRSHGQARVVDLHEELQISLVAVHKQLKRLLGEGLIVRVGKSPIVFYTLPVEGEVISTAGEAEQLTTEQVRIIDSNFLSITPDGRLLYGVAGFINWAQSYQKNRELGLIAQEYVDTFDQQKKLFSPDGWIDATAKLTGTFNQTPVTHLLFQDIYSYRTFGRTKLAKLVMHAKQTGELDLIDSISTLAKPLIEKIIKKHAIEAVIFIPPTIPRPVQFMKEFASRLNLSLPKIDLVKVYSGDIRMAQKVLSSLDERVMNARDTIFVKNNNGGEYRNVLLIDDVAGSGASFQETAKKLRQMNIGTKTIIAFALVGNIKGYDVVREI